ncbi:MAG: ABC transporter permease subunit [Clostridia bacterium]|nr:ABC transporter permease subunit [Clostridia bacterium]
MFKLKCDDFLIYNEETGTYSMADEQKVRDETERNRWKNTGWTILKDWRLYIMLVPMVLVYFLWKYMPMYELMGCFKNPTTANEHGTVASMSWTGLRYFEQLFSDPTYSWQFWRAFRNTFTTAFYGLLFGFPMPIILALFFNEVKSNVVRSIMQVCVYLPKFLSTVIVTSLVLMLFRGNGGSPDEQSVGIVSKVFQWFGASDSLVSNGLVYTTKYYRAIYIITDLWEHAGYDSIVFFAAVIAVSPTSYEAAQIDGAGKMAQMRYVVIPSILSTVVIMLIMKIGSLLSVGYEKIYLLLGEGPAIEGKDANYEVAHTVSTLANEWSNQQDRKAMGTAAEMLNNLIGMILVIGANKIARTASDVSLY